MVSRTPGTKRSVAELSEKEILELAAELGALQAKFIDPSTVQTGGVGPVGVPVRLRLL